MRLQSRVVGDDVAPEYGNIAASLVAQAGKDIDSGRLARAVGPEQTIEVAGLNLEGDAIERRDVRVMLVELADLYGGRHGRHAVFRCKRGTYDRAPSPAIIVPRCLRARGTFVNAVHRERGRS